MMRYAILNIKHAINTKEVIYVYIHLFSSSPEYKAVWTAELQRTRDDRRQCIIFLWLLWEDEPESVQQPASQVQNIIRELFLFQFQTLKKNKKNTLII